MNKHSKRYFKELLLLTTKTFQMNPVSKFVWRFSANARRKRAELFRSLFEIDDSTKVLDLGSENGKNISNVLQGLPYRPENIYIADIDKAALDYGKNQYGFNPVLIDESGRLPFPDNYFDVVYCSSVIEHVTLPKSDLWDCKDGEIFKRDSWLRQKDFAKEIDRLGKEYFVQTPCKTFPIESHTWLPLVGFLPRRLFLPILKLSNRFWIKVAEPDFNLLGESEMHQLFPDAKLFKETKLGFTKSIMKVKLHSES